MLIQKATDMLISGRTSIVIAHRLSTIRKANKIIVLDKGEIKEIGTHEELLDKGGFYAKLHEMQFQKTAIS
jgi:ATP-binding cassette subfamily B protein